jgi:acyl-coenzyme A thioesterase PaaI-like protein
LVSREESSFDAAVVPRSPSGMVLCLEPCSTRGSCCLGIIVERLDAEDSAYYEIECPADHRERPELAHGAWTAAVLSEMCGVLPVLLGTIAYMGTLTVRFQAPVPMGERLIGRARLDGRERRKLFVSATLASSATGAELAKASMIMIAAQSD